MSPRFHPHPELSPLCDRLWDADKNRLTPGVHYKIDPQGKTRFHSRQDHASDPLFAFVDPEVFQRPTYKRKCITEAYWLPQVTNFCLWVTGKTKFFHISFSVGYPAWIW